MEERTEDVPGYCQSLAHPREQSVNAMWCRTCRSGIGAGIAWLEVLNVDIRSIQGRLINFHLCAVILAF